MSSSDPDQSQVIETRLAQLTVERIGLLRQLNAIRSSPRALPSEILSEVFKVAPAPLVIGAVCSHWRTVAWDTPQLWTTIECSPDDAREVTENSVYLLRLFSQNSRELKLTVILNFDQWNREAREHSDVVHEILVTIATDLRERIKVMVFQSQSNYDWRLWRTAHRLYKNAHFPNLENLHLFGEAGVRVGGSFQNVPHLRCLSLSHTSPGRHTFWNQLTTIKLKAVPIRVCVDVLIDHPPQLEFFECLDPLVTDLDDRFELLFHPTVTLPNLKTFEWSGCLGYYAKHLWRVLRVPAIRTLIWNHTEPPTNLPNCCFFYYSRFSTLEALKIQSYSSPVDVCNLLRSLRSIRVLDLCACELQRAGINIMDILTFFHITDREDTNPLPILKVLHLDILTASGFSQMLRSRCNGPISMDGREVGLDFWESHSRLEKAVLYMEDWEQEPGEKQVLQDLISGGLQLDLYIGGERVDLN